MATDLVTQGYLDASKYYGIELDILGDGKSYNIHLRTGDTQQVWQSYRCCFTTTNSWQRIFLPFSAFVPHRIETNLDTAHLRRIGIVSIGNAGKFYVAFPE